MGRVVSTAILTLVALALLTPEISAFNRRRVRHCCPQTCEATCTGCVSGGPPMVAGANPSPAGDPRGEDGIPIPMVRAGAPNPRDAELLMDERKPPNTGEKKTIFQICFYEANGEYAGYSYSESVLFLYNQGTTWMRSSLGRYWLGYYVLYTKCPNPGR